ncbi:MAG: hypothetical protein KGL51_15725 [Betaproteobacteria bacterium]|nr:hypothetical protein [Betaproteobacteria bacterium]MDE2123333.1 hypothetical protein [Betaproteobacteria bacterium]MDE2187909.1 hypothetical protein [Betaproteobacteria bacterium]MDE2326088.1 hypothetical protein [Betaproteobacteria bacterium]
MPAEHEPITEQDSHVHAAVHGPEGALDRKTRQPIGLGAALGTNHP